MASACRLHASLTREWDCESCSIAPVKSAAICPFAPRRRAGHSSLALSFEGITMNDTPTPNKKITKILIVDDHPIVREGLAARIARQPDLEVCGEAEDVLDAMEKVKAVNPDLVIVDLSLKSGQGLDLIKKIKARSVETKMLVS